jgi:microcystin-dependent protein
MDEMIAVIKLFAGNFAPRNFAFCQGQILSIAQNTALFSLLGTTYGGNGQTTFALPDFRGRVPVGTGQGPGLPSVQLGEMAGAPTHTLITTEMPAHTHAVPNLVVSGANANTHTPVANVRLGGAVDNAGLDAFTYTTDTATSVTISTVGTATAIVGGSQPHNNMQPYLGMNFIIAIFGIFPSRN